jgi:hypothetical protein
MRSDMPLKVNVFAASFARLLGSFFASFVRPLCMQKATEGLQIKGKYGK